MIRLIYFLIFFMSFSINDHFVYSEYNSDGPGRGAENGPYKMVDLLCWSNRETF